MKVENKIKDLSLDINTIGLYDKAEEREKAIAKNLLKDGFSVDKISKYTGLSEKNC